MIEAVYSIEHGRHYLTYYYEDGNYNKQEVEGVKRFNLFDEKNINGIDYLITHIENTTSYDCIHTARFEKLSDYLNRVRISL
jgi:hypothetical protein